MVSVHFLEKYVISSVRKRYCALGLAEIRFRPNLFSSKCSRSLKMAEKHRKILRNQCT